MTRPRRPVHVLQVVHSLTIGGTERVVHDLVRHFNDDEFRTTVGCLDGLGEFGEDLRAAGVAVHLLGRRPGVDLRVVGRLSRLCRATGVDIVHAHQYTPYFYAALSGLLARPVRVIFTEHGRHYPDRVRRRRVIGNQILRPVTAAYTAVSDFTRRSLVTLERIPRSRIEVIYNGIDVPVAHDDSPRARARAGLGLDQSAAVVLSVGRLDRVKDFGTLVRAMTKVVIDVPEAVLLIAGGGDEAYRQELIRLADELGIADHVRLLGSRRDVPALLAACDVFTLTSVTEALSMTILEAMAAGRPVLATDVGGNAEVVVPGETGVLIPVGDSSAAAQALIDLLTDPRRARGMGAAGRRRVRERFTRAATFEAYRRLYRRTLGL